MDKVNQRYIDSNSEFFAKNRNVQKLIEILRNVKRIEIFVLFITVLFYSELHCTFSDVMVTQRSDEIQFIISDKTENIEIKTSK